VIRYYNVHIVTFLHAAVGELNHKPSDTHV